jgi:hypothetical protein
VDKADFSGEAQFQKAIAALTPDMRNAEEAMDENDRGYYR